MGACTFTDVAKGSTAKEAFENATSDARYEHGHGGYTGTIAEKHSFTIIPFTSPSGAEKGTPEFRKEVGRYADQLIEDDDYRVTDKWGPAGCIDLGNGEYLFFGWASS